MKLIGILQDLSDRGLINCNYTCYIDSLADAVFVRVSNEYFAESSGTQITRGTKFASKHNLSSKLLCTFDNGLAMEYIQGTAITWPTAKLTVEEEVTR